MRPSLPKIPLAVDVSVRTSSGAFVTVPRMTLVVYEREVNGHCTVHRFYHAHRGERLVHITVCQGDDKPSWNPYQTC